MLTLLFGAVSLLYATVGQAGGTAFLAVMAFASFPSNEMRPTALVLNIVAATYSTWLFNRGSRVDWKELRPLLIASLPTALAGGFVVLDERIYNAVTGSALILAGAISWSFAGRETVNRVGLLPYGARSQWGRRSDLCRGLPAWVGASFLLRSSSR